MLSFALVNWGSSSVWIGTYFLGRIEKTMIYHKLLHSLKSLGHFQWFEEYKHKCSCSLWFEHKLGEQSVPKRSWFNKDLFTINNHC